VCENPSEKLGVYEAVPIWLIFWRLLTAPRFYWGGSSHLTVLVVTGGIPIVFIPKCRRKTLYADLRRHHVHMIISIAPKYAVSQIVGFINGTSGTHLAHVYSERKRIFVGQHFWARGYVVSRVGRVEGTIRQYIRNQEKEDQRLEQLYLSR
jgi:putative transposase